MTREFSHVPVMLREVIEGLNVRKDGLYVDGTVGGAGHAMEICRLGGRLIGIDRDEEALEVARGRLAGFDVELIHGNFDNAELIMQNAEILLGKEKSKGDYAIPCIDPYDGSAEVFDLNNNAECRMQKYCRVEEKADTIGDFGLPRDVVPRNDDGGKSVICHLSSVGCFDGVLLDLGVSSYQLDCVERGFSYHGDAKLDMRMDRGQELTAEVVVNEYEERELTRIIREYGEERFAGRIARNIVASRPIGTTGELVEVIKKSAPFDFREKHPARRTFQAIRIEVNSELSSIKKAIGEFARRLKSGGRLAIISFHSLEDRIVKEEFNRLANPKCVCPAGLPVCGCGAEKGEFRVITKRPIVAGEDEIRVNARSRSAKLRIIEKQVIGNR